MIKTFISIIFRPENRHRHMHRHHRLHRTQRWLLSPRRPRLHASDGVDPWAASRGGFSGHRACGLARRLQHLPRRCYSLSFRCLRSQNFFQGLIRLIFLKARTMNTEHRFDFLAKLRKVERVLSHQRGWPWWFTVYKNPNGFYWVSPMLMGTYPS